MDPNRIDHVSRACWHVLSRRHLASMLGLAAIIPGLATAKSKRKKKLKRNGFGCVNVGGKCRGKDAACCSGICQGKKPKKGKKDKSRCVGRNVIGCLATSEVCGGPVQMCGVSGYCYHTTGNAGFCGMSSGAGCSPCRTDTECDTVSGPGSACVICDNCSTPGQTACIPPAPAFLP